MQIQTSWRRPSRARLAFAWGFASVVFADACTSSSSLPGTSLGNFSVVGTVGNNSCGSGVGAQSPWDFTVEMSKDGSTLYMAQTDGSDEVYGALSSTSATLVSTTTSNPDATEAGAGSCDLTQTTSFAITLDSASSPSSFSGSVTYTYSVATGVSTTTDCTDQLASSGGAYSTLPCTVTYSLTATKQ